MPRLVVEACAVTAIAVAAIICDLHTRWWLSSFGVLLFLTWAVIIWLAVAGSTIRRLRGNAHPQLTPALEVAASVPRHRVFAVLYFAPFSLVPHLFFSLQPQHMRPPLWFLVIPVSFALIAALIGTWSYGVVVDASARRIRRWRGARIGPLLYPVFEHVVEVPTDARVSLDDVRRQVGKSGGYHICEIAIDTPQVLVHEQRDADAARLRAEELAKMLGLDLVDRSTAIDEERVRKLRELDLPLADQLRLRGVTSARRDLPAKTTLALESDTMPWVVRVNPRGLRGSDVFALAITAPFIYLGSVIPAVIITVAALDQPARFAFLLGVVIAAAVGWYALWQPVLAARRGVQLIHLSHSGIRVARRAPGAVSSGQLAAERIEEIVITYNRGVWTEGLCVVARGDGVSLAFGHGLDRDDAIWLRDTAIAALAPRSIYR